MIAKYKWWIIGALVLLYLQQKNSGSTFSVTGLTVVPTPASTAGTYNSPGGVAGQFTQD